MGSYFNSIVKNENNCVENRSKYTNKYSRCCYNQDAVVLFRLSNLGAFVFEFILDAVIIKSAVVFAPIRYYNRTKWKQIKTCHKSSGSIYGIFSLPQTIRLV